ncbi:hypothetical protein [Marilutibacter aestuarii]|uniref:Uncharacterized protein n=1 Tax=Marilutibacter aestuarii TaxID=1706195 RepID=A0A508A5W4_9GAMM|nr:hypothetical protein [Lysobacter aestuarii]TQD42365.1 hypothetical protein FKV25_11820 [Lysobacter aestuarii]
MNSKISEAFEAKPIVEEVLTVTRFLKLSVEEKQRVKESQIVPPRLGASGFGGILVRYKLPQYRVGP